MSLAMREGERSDLCMYKYMETHRVNCRNIVHFPLDLLFTFDGNLFEYTLYPQKERKKYLRNKNNI